MWTRLRTLALLGAAAALLPGQAFPGAEPLSQAARPADSWFAHRILPPDYIFHFRPRLEIPGRPTVSLVLSGGGARGAAHAGLLQQLEQGGYPIDNITGTSAGAIVGALYACGFSGTEIEALFNRVDFGRAFLDPLVRTPGQTLQEQESENGTVFSFQVDRGLPTFAMALRSGVTVQRTLEGFLARGAFLSGGDFDRLRLPFRVVATNLETGEPRLFGRGDLVEVLRASMAVPAAFRPVVLDGQQYVDGALVENIPVQLARNAFQSRLVLASDVSSPLERSRTTNAFSLTARSLDLVIERQQHQSRAAASLVIRPEMGDVPFMDYSTHLPQLVQAGREAFTREEEAFRTLILATAGGDLDLDTREVIVEGLEGLDEATRARLLRTLHPQGPLRRSHVMAALHHVIVMGHAARVDTQLEGERLRLTLVPHPPVRAHVVEAGVPGEQLLAQLKAALPIDRPFNPERFGSLLSQWVHGLVMEGAPLVDVRASGFDPGTGTLKVVAWEPRIQTIDVRGGSRLEAAYLQSVMAPLLGLPLRTEALRRRLDLAEQRLRLAELRYQLRPSQGPSRGADLVLVPVHHRPLSIDLSLGYESHMQGFASLHFQALNLGGTGAEVEADLRKNALEEGLAFQFRGPLKGFPGAGIVAGLRTARQSLGHLFSQDAPEISFLPGATLGYTDVVMGSFIRFGHQGQGKLAMEMVHRNTYFDQVYGRSARQERVVQVSSEWDDVDRHSFPREGRVLRTVLGEGTAFPGLEPSGYFRFAYLRSRRLTPLPRQIMGHPLSLDLDLEWGYGRDLPLDRWWPLGGPSSLMGSRTFGLRAPNFLLLRTGLPLQMPAAFGSLLQFQPRLDLGWFSRDAGALFAAARTQGAGVSVKAMVSKFYVELSLGHRRYRDIPRTPLRRENAFTLVLGTQPFDLWGRR